MVHAARFRFLAAALLQASVIGATAAHQTTALGQLSTPPPQLKVFLDCESCFADFLRSDIEFVDYVRDRTEAEVHILITQSQTGSGGSEYNVTFIGAGRFDGVVEPLRTVTGSSDTDDVVRRQLAATVRVGLLRFLTREGVPPRLDVSVRLGSEGRRPAVAGDRWNNWVFSLRGSATFEGEESSRERQVGASVSADRITPDWKITLGGELEYEREEFDLDEDVPVKVERRERDFNWLVVKALGEHWSVGGIGEIESSTFENISLSASGAPAVEYNVFPYSMHTRRQLRALYAVGMNHLRYYEETLFGKTSETLPQHELSLTFEQRERWGSLQAGVEWSQFLNDLTKSRLQADGVFSVRLARGLSVASELSASRIRDQLSLPARGATPEEVLLRLRQLESGYEYSFSASLTYTFGSIFSSVVNPRFGN
jgi:hypothetical protein